MKFYTLTLFFLCCSFFSYSVETKIIVRAKAKDAKFVGSSLGGAYVKITHKLSGAILAQGKTTGSTGNTDLIMRTPATRGMAIADEQTAKFLASVDIDEPTFVSIEVLSPLNHKQAQARVSTELWLIPGKHILGDGIVLEIPGFIIDILKPRTHRYLALEEVRKNPFTVQANIVMMCGCTINKEGLWDSEKMEVKALVKRNDQAHKEVTMSWVDTNLFTGVFDLQEAGQYEITVYAFDVESGNTGVAQVNYVVYE